jgi:hypothetical protein
VIVDALTISRGQHIIIDHCSLNWATDEVIQIWYDARDITIQWSIIAEGLNDSTHAEGPHSRGALIGDQSTRISFHHNLLAHNVRRNPRVTGGDVDIVNNVVYNAEGTPTRLFADAVGGNTAGGRYNYVGNYIKPGPNSTWTYELKLRSNDGTSITAYVAGNIGPNRPDASIPDRAIVDPDSREFLVADRHDFPVVRTTSAFLAYDHVLAEAGAMLPLRDAVDARIVSDVDNTTGHIIDHPSDVGGWPVLATGTPPDDDDHDGMPDAWENLYGFDPYDPTDSPADADGDGYTNVEEYLNGTNPRSTQVFLPLVLRDG